MADRNFIKQRIDIFAGKPINPNSDIQVKEALYNLDIKLPQKNLLDDALIAANNSHEIIRLILQYRKLS
jgi:DNA polymerase I-like protein with 3'-5' exonuclease and polymerase domains